MSHGCKIDKQDAAYFSTYNVIDWENVFVEDRFKIILQQEDPMSKRLMKFSEAAPNAIKEKLKY